MPDQQTRSRATRPRRTSGSTDAAVRPRFSLFVPPRDEEQVASLHSRIDLDTIDPDSHIIGTVKAIAQINSMVHSDCSQQIAAYRKARQVGHKQFMYANSVSQDIHDKTLAGPGFEVLCPDWPTSPCYTAADAKLRKATLQAAQEAEQASITTKQQEAEQKAIETSGSWSQTASEEPPISGSVRTSQPRSIDAEQQSRFKAVECADEWTRSRSETPTI